MNTMVAARVPVEIKEQGDSLLKSLGSSPTELINKAYEYLLKYKKLPETSVQGADEAPAKRVITAEMMNTLMATYEEISLPLNDAWGDKSFSEIREGLEEERYARFA